MVRVCRRAEPPGLGYPRERLGFGTLPSEVATKASVLFWGTLRILRRESAKFTVVKWKFKT